MNRIRVHHLIQLRERAETIYGQRPSDGKVTPEDLSSGEVADFLLRHPEVTTRSTKIHRCLAWLEAEFGT